MTPFAAAIALTMFIIAAVFAQPAPTNPPGVPPTGDQEQTAADTERGWPTLESLRATIAAVESAPESEIGDRARILTAYRTAIADLEAAAQALAQAEVFDSDRAEAPRRLTVIREELAALTATPNGEPKQAPLEELESQLTNARAELERWRAERDALAAEASRRTARLAELPSLITQRNEISRSAPESFAPPADADRLTYEYASEAQAAAAARKARAELRLFEAEQASYSARTELLTARRERADRLVARLTRQVEQLEQRAAALRAEAARVQAEQSRAQAEALPPELAEAAEAVATLADGLEELQRQIGVDRREADAAVERRSRIARRFDDVRDRARDIEFGPWLGVQLRAELRRLPDVGPIARQSRRLAQEINAERRRGFEVGSALRSLSAEIDDEIQFLLGLVADRERWRDDATAIVRQRLDILRGLDVASSERLSALVRHDAALRETIAVTREMSRFIEERVLWVRSGEPIGGESVDRIRVEIAGSRAIWRGAITAVRSQFVAQPVRNTAAALLTLVVIAGSIRSWRKSKDLAGVAKSTSRSASWHMLGSLLFAVVAALGPAAPMVFVGWYFSSIAENWTPAVGVAAGAYSVALFFFSVRLVNLICRDGSIGDRDFNWPADARRMMTRTIRWWWAPGAATLFAMRVAGATANAGGASEAERLLLMLWLLGLGWIAWRLLGRDRPLMRAFWGADRSAWLYRLWPIVHGSALLALATLITAAGAGYIYTASRLADRVGMTAGVIAAVVVARALLRRWAILQRRRLAVERLRAEQQRDVGDTARDLPSIPEPDSLDIGSVGEQTMRLLRATLFAALVVGILVVWMDVVPALGVFRDVLVPGVRLTLGDVAAAVIAVFVTVVLARNLPGLLEVTALRRLPLDAGGRYAITSLLRYTIVVVGVLAGAAAMGLRWQQVQWLAAAATVGLGFGLQEIFANFVSGLIILFERPVRVGDTVTVGDLTGTVTRIRIRATTILDWDRKEIIIPNKEFITTQLINWTLTDAVLRVICPVGIAYGSDIRKAERLLLEIAAETPHVLADPPPRAVFVGFGDSTLNFELRVFIESIDYFIAARHDINNAIDAKFREHGVEIAFPQRDLHIRTVSDSLAESIAAAVTRRGSAGA